MTIAPQVRPQLRGRHHARHEHIFLQRRYLRSSIQAAGRGPGGPLGSGTLRNRDARVCSAADRRCVTHASRTAQVLPHVCADVLDAAMPQLTAAALGLSQVKP